jgi:Tfp pilus assembly protein PilF
MNSRLRLILTAVGLASLMVATTGCEKLRARDHLNKGVAAFKNAQYPIAVDNFQKAVEYDPNFTTARLYLATAYMSQYIPGADSPDNNKNADAAKREFKKVLDSNPNDKLALASLASLAYNEAQGIPKIEDKIKKLDEAKEWNEKLTTADPTNKEAFYSLGVITWAKWYPALMTARAKLGMKPEDPGPIKDKKVKEELRSKYLTMVNDGIADLKKAIEIDKEYDDAMAYVNLLVRERADLADSGEQYKKEVDEADQWVQRTLDTKKAKNERLANAGPGGVQTGK